MKRLLTAATLALIAGISNAAIELDSISSNVPITQDLLNCGDRCLAGFLRAPLLDNAGTDFSITFTPDEFFDGQFYIEMSAATALEYTRIERSRYDFSLSVVNENGNVLYSRMYRQDWLAPPRELAFRAGTQANSPITINVRFDLEVGEVEPCWGCALIPDESFGGVRFSVTQVDEPAGALLAFPALALIAANRLRRKRAAT